jgi:hypothetical protein
MLPAPPESPFVYCPTRKSTDQTERHADTDYEPDVHSQRQGPPREARDDADCSPEEHCFTDVPQDVAGPPPCAYDAPPPVAHGTIRSCKAGADVFVGTGQAPDAAAIDR